MVGRPLSETKKNQITHEAQQAFGARAVKAYKEELEKPEGEKCKGSWTVVHDFVHLYKQETGLDIKIDYNILIWQTKGVRTKAQTNGAKCWLTEGEQGVVIVYIVECGQRGFPLSHCRLKEHVNEILRIRIGNRFSEGGVGKKWSDRFIEKYSKKLKTSWATPLESKRGHAVNPHTVKAWFDLFIEIDDKYCPKEFI
jgi:Tc5 transposase DNA-binding domain